MAKIRVGRSKLIFFVIFLLAAYAIIPSLPKFKKSFDTLRNGDLKYVFATLLLVASTYVLSALIYKVLAPKRLALRRVVLVQIASGFSNRLLPAGAGNIALNNQFLTASGLTRFEAAGVIIANNVVAFVADVLILALALVYVWHEGLGLRIHPSINPAVNKFWPVVIALVLVIGMVLAFKLRAKNYAKKAIQQFANVISHRSVLLAGLLSIALTLLFVGALQTMMLAFNVHLPLVTTLIVYLFGVIAATLTPTPGGVGGAEAALTGALVAVGVSAQQALTVSLTYRFVVFWLPVLPGYVAFRQCLKRSYI